MKKIATVALATRFNTSAKTIYEICQATAQPETAMEMLLGLYKAPAIRNLGLNKEDRDCVLSEFRPLKDTYHQVEYVATWKVTRYFRDAAHAKDNAVNSYSGNDVATERYPYEHTYDVHMTDSTSLSTWNEYADKWDKAAIARMEAERAAFKSAAQRLADEFDTMYPQHEGNNDEL